MDDERGAALAAPRGQVAAHVGRNEALRPRHPLERHTERRADAAARAVGSDDPAGVQLATRRRGNAHARVVLGEPCDRGPLLDDRVGVPGEMGQQQLGEPVLAERDPSGSQIAEVGDALARCGDQERAGREGKADGLGVLEHAEAREALEDRWEVHECTSARGARPTSGSRSSTCTVTPARARPSAVTRPSGPAPATMTSTSPVSGVVIAMVPSSLCRRLRRGLGQLARVRVGRPGDRHVSDLRMADQQRLELGRSPLEALGLDELLDASTRSTPSSSMIAKSPR
jgi:hypothetical protein